MKRRKLSKAQTASNCLSRPSALTSPSCDPLQAKAQVLLEAAESRTDAAAEALEQGLCRMMRKTLTERHAHCNTLIETLRRERARKEALMTSWHIDWLKHMKKWIQGADILSADMMNEPRVSRNTQWTLGTCTKPFPRNLSPDLMKLPLYQSRP